MGNVLFCKILQTLKGIKISASVEAGKPQIKILGCQGCFSAAT
jgi:hypothetical protein